MLKFDLRSVITGGGSNSRDVVLAGASTTLRFRLSHVPSTSWTITDPVGKVTTFAYGGDGKLDSITDPASRVTSFEHDSEGNLTKIVDPDLSEREFAYDEAHRLTSQTSKRDFVTTYAYDFAGRFARSDLPDGSDRQLTAAQTVGLVDTSGGQGSSGTPAPVVRPDDVMAASPPSPTRPASPPPLLTPAAGSPASAARSAARPCSSTTSTATSSGLSRPTRPKWTTPTTPAGA